MKPTQLKGEFRATGFSRGGKWLALWLALAVPTGQAGNAYAGSAPEGVNQRLLYGQVIPQYLANFGNYTGWPAAVQPAGADFRIGVLGRDPLNGALERLVAGKKLKGRTVVVVHSDDPGALVGCQIVFADQPTPGGLARLVAAMTGHPVLTVVFQPEGRALGAMVQLVLTPEGGVRYTLDNVAIRQAGLDASAALLQLALRNPTR